MERFNLIFNAPSLLSLIPIVALIIFGFSLLTRRFHQRFVRQFGRRETIRRFSHLGGNRWKTTFLLAVMASLLLVALAEPVSPDSTRSVGRVFNYIVVIDVSRSMGAEDYPLKTSRIEMARQTLNNLFREYPKGVIGLAPFTDQATPYTTTTDHKVVRFLVNYGTEPGKVRGEGSALNVGLEAALKLIEDSPEVKTIIVLSDGGNDEPTNLWGALHGVKSKGVRIIACGLGGDELARIPNRDPKTGEIIGYHRLGNRYALTGLQEGPLRVLGDETGGDYIRIITGSELVQAVSRGSYETSIVEETGERSLVKIPLTAMLVALLVWVVDKRFFQR